MPIKSNETSIAPRTAVTGKIITSLGKDGETGTLIHHWSDCKMV